MVKDPIWSQAWAGRLKPWHALDGQQILCVGCLEARIGRTLMACDFSDVPINNPDRFVMSKRLRARIRATAQLSLFKPNRRTITMLKLTPYQIKVLEAAGFTIDDEGEVATRPATVSLIRLDDGSWHHVVHIPDNSVEDGRTLDDLLACELAEVRELARDGDA
jgi:hypothetical protein